MPARCLIDAIEQVNNSDFFFSPLNLVCSTQLRTAFGAVSFYEAILSLAACCALWGRPTFSTFAPFSSNRMSSMQQMCLNTLPCGMRWPQDAGHQALIETSVLLGTLTKTFFGTGDCLATMESTPTSGVCVTPSGNEPMYLLRGCPCQVEKIIDLSGS